MDLTKMTVIELKALVYDMLAQEEQCRSNRNIVNQEIIKRANQPIEEVAEVPTA